MMNLDKRRIVLSQEIWKNVRPLSQVHDLGPGLGSAHLSSVHQCGRPGLTTDNGLTSETGPWSPGAEITFN